MIIDIDIETLFPEGLSDEAISAIKDVLHEIAMQWESKHYHQLKRFRSNKRLTSVIPYNPGAGKI